MDIKEAGRRWDTQTAAVRSPRSRDRGRIEGSQEATRMPKLLLVEDNEYNRDMLLRRLQRKGFQVVCALDGAEGCAKAQTEQPDLILMDMHLPVLDGWEVTRRLKADAATRAIPIVALTADAM